MTINKWLLRSAHRSWGYPEDYADARKEELSKPLDSKEAWSRLLPLARDHTRKAWEELHGKPLYSPRYHVKVKLKRKGVRRLRKKYIAAAVAELPEGVDEGLYLV